jgi:hypothetical protein
MRRLSSRRRGAIAPSIRGCSPGAGGSSCGGHRLILVVVPHEAGRSRAAISASLRQRVGVTPSDRGSVRYGDRQTIGCPMKVKPSDPFRALSQPD